MKKYENPKVEVGDVIQLIYMEDDINAVPPLTNGVVVGFEDDPWETRINIDWEDGRTLPLYPSVDIYRLGKTREPQIFEGMDKIVVTKKDLLKINLLREQYASQEINYTNVGQPQKYGNREYVYITGTDAEKDPSTEKIILSGPNGDVVLDSFEVKDAKFGGLQINYNNDTRHGLDRLINFIDPNQKSCNFVKKALLNGAWKKKGLFRNQTFGAIQNSLKEIYSNNIAGPGEPTERHIPNGFLNIPGTDAEGTNHGWSIINFFNTNPSVRAILVSEYQNYVKDNGLPCRFNIYDFTDWIRNNKHDIFGFNSELFQRLVKTNQGTWANGQKNEKAVKPYLKNFYGDEWDLVETGEPGIRKDALSGIDMSMVNSTTNEEHTFQAKPLSSVEEKDGKWVVRSGWLQWYDPRQVTHFIFGNVRGEAYIFKNQGQHPQRDSEGREIMIFNYPPLP